MERRPDSASGLSEDLVRIVGASHVLVDADAVIGYSTDWTGRHHGRVDAVVRPATPAEVAAVLAVCSGRGVAVIAQGGNTGLVGGGVAGRREIGTVVILSMARLQRLDPVDDVSGMVTAGAGVTLAGLHSHVRGTGWRYPVDFGARDRATVGGMIATNAGGARAARFGSTRARLAGIEAVFADGSVVGQLDRPSKDNTGYDLAGLLCGSEGTLGVVTAATMSLVSTPRHRSTALVWMTGLGESVALGVELRRSVGSVEAVEFMDGACLGVLADAGHRVPPHARSALLVEAGADVDPTDVLARAIEGQAGVSSVSVATDDRFAAELWELRDAIAEVIRRIGLPVKLDVAVPLRRLTEVLDRLPSLVEAVEPDARLFRFGHCGDGNIHINIIGARDDRRLIDVVLQLVVGAGGTISAEHGVGADKTGLLELVRSPAELEAFAAIKFALDPVGLLNPGVIVAQAGTH